MSDQPERARQLFKALDQLLETLLEGSDQPGIKAAARDLRLLEGDEIVIANDDEQPAILDHYLFIADAGDGRTRIQRFAAEPPEGLGPDARGLLDALTRSHVSIFESRAIGRGGADRSVTARDLVYPEFAQVTFADHRLTPFTANDQAFLVRVLELDGYWLCTDLAMEVPQKMRKFFLRRGPVHEFATLVSGAAGAIVDEEAPIDQRTMVRAVFGSRLAQHLALEDGETLEFAKKRSLARRPDKSRRKRR